MKKEERKFNGVQVKFKGKELIGTLIHSKKQLTLVDFQNITQLLSIIYTSIGSQHFLHSSPTHLEILLKRVSETQEPDHYLFIFPDIESKQFIQDQIGQRLDFEKELKIRKNILFENDQLRKLHFQLVQRTEDLGEEEFWSIRNNLIQQEKERLSQKKGLTNYLQGDRRATAKNQINEVEISLNQQIIESIFALFPGVKTLYEELVPNKKDRKSFWEEYFLADFFSRNPDKGKPTRETIFDKYKRELDEEAREIKKQRVDSSIFVDIAATEEARDSILMCPSLSSLGTGLKIEPDDFLAADRTMRAGSIQPFLVCTSRLHRHANFLLHPNQEKPQSVFLHTHLPEDEDKNSAIIFNDLNYPPPDDSIPLKIKSENLLFEAIVSYDEKGTQNKDTEAKIQKVQAEIGAWKPELKKTKPFSSSKQTLELLSNLIQSSEEQNVKIDGDIRDAMAEGVELLRHFWCCTDDFQRNEKIKTKLAQMRERLLSDMIPSTSTISLEARNSLSSSISHAIMYKQN